MDYTIQQLGLDLQSELDKGYYSKKPEDIERLVNWADALILTTPADVRPDLLDVLITLSEMAMGPEHHYSYDELMQVATAMINEGRNLFKDGLPNWQPNTQKDQTYSTQEMGRVLLQELLKTGYDNQNPKDVSRLANWAYRLCYYDRDMSDEAKDVFKSIALMGEPGFYEYSFTELMTVAQAMIQNLENSFDAIDQARNNQQ